MIDGGLFAQGSRLIPSELPMLKDPKFQKDRKDFSGRSFGPEEMKKGRPEALTHVRNGFVVLEESILADGREWVLGAKGPTLVDIEGRRLIVRKRRKANEVSGLALPLDLTPSWCVGQRRDLTQDLPQDICLD